MYQSGQSQSVDGGLPSKTPVSLLQELCMRRGISPKYDLLQIEGPVHEPTFVYRVTVGEYAANGSGQTKKKAKHAAAKAVLDIIIQGGSGSQGQLGSAPELSSQIVSPYDDGIPGNPVGALQELCMSRRWPPPTYELSAEEGFPHERTFSICCTIGNHKEIGAGKSKKLSKRQAANKMLLKLKDQPVDNLPMNVLADDDDEVNKDSAYPVAEGSGSCPSLRKACTKDRSEVSSEIRGSEGYENDDAVGERLSESESVPQELETRRRSKTSGTAEEFLPEYSDDGVRADASGYRSGSQLRRNLRRN